MSSESKVDLLWTGGWDSTFQLLRLLLIERRVVEPFYLIDEDRRSSGVEMRTMRDIGRLVRSKYPFTKELLLKTRYHAVSDISSDDVIDHAFERIRERRYLGEQYKWIASFCKEQHVNGLQLCIHRDDKAHELLAALVEKGVDGCYRLQADTDGSYEHQVFKYFTFPLMEYTKTAMFDIAVKNNFTEVMEMTWFCHRPTRKGRPCGVCNPCIYTIEEGLGHRVPISGRLKMALKTRAIMPLQAMLRRQRKY